MSQPEHQTRQRAGSINKQSVILAPGPELTFKIQNPPDSVPWCQASVHCNWLGLALGHSRINRIKSTTLMHHTVAVDDTDLLPGWRLGYKRGLNGVVCGARDTLLLVSCWFGDTQVNGELAHLRKVLEAMFDMIHFAHTPCSVSMRRAAVRDSRAFQQLKTVQLM